MAKISSFTKIIDLSKTKMIGNKSHEQGHNYEEKDTSAAVNWAQRAIVFVIDYYDMSGVVK